MNGDSLRRAHNYLHKVKNNNYDTTDLELLNNYISFTGESKKYKVALLMVSVNSQYWPYAGQVFEDIQKYFLPGHKIDAFLWSDMPKITEEQFAKKEEALRLLEEETKTPISFELRGQLIFAALKECVEATYLWTQADQQKVAEIATRLGLGPQFQPIDTGNANLILNNIGDDTIPKIVSATREVIKKQKNLQNNATQIEVEPIEWPYGTLMRYSMFLSEEEKLKEYDYIFYMDVDMRVVNVVGDEILGQRLTIAPHPGYFLRKELYPPYEPNDKSASFIKRPGKVVEMEGRPRFMPFYAAGGFQGGTSKSYLKAMKETKKLIDKDLNINNYIPIWNDETAWNKYVFDGQTKEEIDQTIFLTPSYIYPDSLIKEYYEKFWGQSFPPKIVTLTKPFTVQKIDMGKFNTM